MNNKLRIGLIAAAFWLIGMVGFAQGNFFWSHTGAVEDITSHPRWDYIAGNEGLDTFGFRALPSGLRDETGNFFDIGEFGWWWSATDLSGYGPYYRRMGFNNTKVFRSFNTKNDGHAVRLVRNYVAGDGTKEDGRILENAYSDADGNNYNGVIIGEQVWITENLKTTSYNDTTAISTGYTDIQWSNLETGAYTIYDHTLVDGIDSDAEMIEAYGLLYNWYAVDNESGFGIGDWHVPTDAAWTQLTDYLINNYNETITTFPDGSTATDITSDNVGKHLKSIRTEAP